MRSQRKALLLYHVGPRVREIAQAFEQTEPSDYNVLVTQLNKDFTVEVNTTFQRHLFRKCSQSDGKTISQYCAKL